MKYTIYQIINNINHKIYIGMHQTNNLEDDYMGSGVELKQDIKEYGKDNFTKKILYVYENFQDMVDKERELVNKKFVSREDTYNICLGGGPDWSNVNMIGKNLYGYNGKTPSTLENFKKGWETMEKIRKHPKSHTEYKNRISIILKKYYQTHDAHFLGKKHTEETKQKIRESNKDKQKGSKNSQYGTMWITNGTESKKIPKLSDIPEGWGKGYSAWKNKKYIPNLSKDIKFCKECKKQNTFEINKIAAQKHYDEFINGSFNSIRDYCRQETVTLSHVSMSKWFKKYLGIELKQGKKFKK